MIQTSFICPMQCVQTLGRQTWRCAHPFYYPMYLWISVLYQDFGRSWVVNKLFRRVSVQWHFLNDTNIFYVSHLRCLILLPIHCDCLCWWNWWHTNCHGLVVFLFRFLDYLFHLHFPDISLLVLSLFLILFLIDLSPGTVCICTNQRLYAPSTNLVPATLCVSNQ